VRRCCLVSEVVKSGAAILHRPTTVASIRHGHLYHLLCIHCIYISTYKEGATSSLLGLPSLLRLYAECPVEFVLENEEAVSAALQEIAAQLRTRKTRVRSLPVGPCQGSDRRQLPTEFHAVSGRALGNWVERGDFE
jgi:hypothetical protein